MRKTLTIFALLTFGTVGMAFAEDDCFVPIADWQPREAVVQLAADKGWILRRIRIDDGCYEIRGTDVGGRAIEAKIHPSTLRIIELEYEGDIDPHRKQKRQGND